MYDAIVGDFVGAWNALVGTKHASGRGNFMFARQAMTLLEWGARLATGGRRRAEYLAMSKRLFEIEPRYFTLLPGNCADNEEFHLPKSGDHGPRQLLWAMFDLIRNGGAHQYQQLTVGLANRRRFAISIANGPVQGPQLGTVRRQSWHLSYHSQRGVVWLLVAPDTLFMDIKEAIDAAGLPSSALRFHYLPRGGDYRRKRKSFKTTRHPYWNFSSTELVRHLKAGGHVDFRSLRLRSRAASY